MIPKTRVVDHGERKRPADHLFLISQKIQSRHLERIAIVYIRQSTPQQLIDHKESTEIQYGLVNRAQALGWKKDRILVIDEDQGKSADSAVGRLGFQKILAEVGLDHVGIIFGIEMSRLARSNKDWHQLLELCAIFQTLLADQDGVYDPTDYNDRLLLGLKGTMSEAELHIIRARMNQGRINKAKRGELVNFVPVGYIRDISGGIVIDPDEQVQTVVKLLLDKFAELGSMNAVLQYFTKNKLKIGIRPHSGPNRGKVEWRRLSRMTLQNMLHHPIYAGAYRYGYRPTDPRAKIPGRKYTGRKIKSHDECMVLLKDRLPAYILWKQFEENIERLKQNRARAESWGAPRKGPALLSGLIICGRCGCRMVVAYPGKASAGIVRYICMRDYTDYGEPKCQSLKGNGIDRLVSQEVLKVLEPASVQLSLKAAEILKKENAQLRKHWQQSLERAQYESDRAHRQFEVVEPENRLVGRALESRWEIALKSQRQLQEEYDRFQQQQALQLNEADQEKVIVLSSNVRTLWNEPSTTPQDKQNVIRTILKNAVVTVDQNTEKVKVHLHWEGGYVSQYDLIRSVAHYDQLSYYHPLLARIKELYNQKSWPAEIAEQLNLEGWRPPKRRQTFNASMVTSLLSRICKTTYRPNARTSNKYLKSHEYWLDDLARKLGIPEVTIYKWTKRGWISYRQLGGPQGRLILWADHSEIERLKRLRTRPRGWPDEPIPAELTTPIKRKKAA